MLTWHEQYAGGRIVAKSGSVEIGALFPPGNGGKWRWRCFVGGGAAALYHVGQNGETKSELTAKAALDAAWAGFLIRANLEEARLHLGVL